nr:TPM domain-containing protein [Prosthecobacter dejongeii]
MLNGPLVDLARVLSGSQRRSVLKTIQALHQRFPQVSLAAVMTDLLPEIPLALHAFWLFNRGSLFSAVERGGDNHGVLLLIDTSSQRAVTIIGYGLEPFVSEMTLEVCLNAAAGSLAKEEYGPALEAFIREIERQLTTLQHQLPRTFGFEDAGTWLASGESPAEKVMARDDDLY